MSQLSPHFSMSEMTKSQTAIRHGISNTPTQQHLNNLTSLCNNLLEPVREMLGLPIRITSGYRGIELNKRIGGSKTSAHMRGNAADFDCDRYGTPEQIIKKIVPELRKQGIRFDQIILEHNAWVHIAEYNANREQRGQVLIAKRAKNGMTAYEFYEV